jgi:putative ABC transport system permease protein
MRLPDIIRRSGRNLRAAKLRTILTALALAVGGFTLTVTLAAAQGARNYTDRLITSNFDPSSLIVTKDDSLFGGGEGLTKPQEYDPSAAALGGQGNVLVKRLSADDLSKIEKLQGVAKVDVDYQYSAQYVTREGAKRFTANIGSYDTAPKPEVVAGSLPSKLKPGQILLPQDYIDLLGFGSAQAALGKQVSLNVQQLTGQEQTRQMTVAAVVTPPTTNLNFEQARVLLNDSDAADLYNYINQGTPNANQYLNAFVTVKDGEDPAKLLETKTRIEQAGYAAQTAQDTQEFLDQIVNVLQVIILVFGAITLVASFFGVVNTQYISVLERTREIGLMKALGMRARTVSALFVIEATWIGFLGAVIGSLTAFVAGTLLNPWISDKIGFGDDYLLVYMPMQIAGLIVFLMAVTTIAGLLPARKAAKLDPIEALRTE